MSYNQDMKFRNFKLQIFLLNLFVLLMYPFYRYLSKGNSLLAFSDACSLIALILGIIGIVMFLYLHGDFDITLYIANRSFRKDQADFDTFRENLQEKRKDSFNYPLLCCIVMFLIAYISGLYV